MIKKILLSVIFWGSGWLHAELFDLRNSIQTGLEFDSNVFRTFSNHKRDTLFRLLFKHRGSYGLSSHCVISWIYQGGGKKYFTQEAQDTLIQSLEVPIVYRFNEGFSLFLNQDVRYQLEDGSIDVAAGDINENYLSYNTKVGARTHLFAGLRVEPYSSFTYFNFEPEQSYSFTRQSFGLRLSYQIDTNISVTSNYVYGIQQFIKGNRDDTDHQTSIGLARFGDLFSSLTYTFDSNASSQSGFAFDRHQISTVLSYSFGGAEEAKSEGDDSDGRFGIHLLGTLQLKNYPAVFNFDSEGQRFLQTGAEDENFNSMVLKFTYHPKAWLAFESKFTRYSNEFSKVQENFLRMMAYLGVRGTF